MVINPPLLVITPYPLLSPHHLCLVLDTQTKNQKDPQWLIPEGPRKHFRFGTQGEFSVGLRTVLGVCDGFFCVSYKKLHPNRRDLENLISIRDWRARHRSGTPDRVRTSHLVPIHYEVQDEVTVPFSDRESLLAEKLTESGSSTCGVKLSQNPKEYPPVYPVRMGTKMKLLKITNL